jgi:squalene-associated FAD-dependent desaturase
LGIVLKPRVAVIGAGWAGLAAAAALAKQDIAVSVFETAQTLGGRARAVEWQGQRLDNGQHILLGAYGETLRLMRLVGVDMDHTLLRLPLRLLFPGQFDLAAPRLPAPLHLLAGLLLTEGLSWAERRAALTFMIRLRWSNFSLPQDISVLALLQQHRQPHHVVRFLWEPLCLAALNTPLPEASAQSFLNVLRDAFGRRRADSDLLLPRTDLSALFPDRAAGYIRNHGGEVITGTTVDSVSAAPDGFQLDFSGNSATFSHVVCAVPPHRLAALLGNLPELNEAAAAAANLGYQPIYTVWLQYPQPLALPFPMLGLTDGPGQWVLDRDRLCGQSGLLAVVVSAAGPHQAMPQEELAETVHRQLAQLIHDLPTPTWHKVIAEKRATFACTPDCKRPDQRTPLKNFYLAGDYTAGDYPATLEGAVRSGVQCAQLVLATAAP